MEWKYIIATATTLFVVLDPLGNAPVVQHILQDVPAERRTRVLVRELLAVLLLLLFFFFVGSTILSYLGVGKSSLNISGGIMLFLIAVGMVFPGTSVVTNNGAGQHARTVEPFIVPVAVPLIVGPAAISLVMMQSSLSASAVQMGAHIAAIVGAWGLTAVILLFSGKILDRIGQKGAVALTRLMGTLLVLISVQMVLDGIAQYVSDMETQAPAAEAPAVVPAAQE